MAAEPTPPAESPADARPPSQIRLKALLPFALALVALPFVVYHTLLEHAEFEATREARSFSTVISAVRSYYLSNVTNRVLAAGGRAVPTDRYHEVEGGIPIPATFSLELGEAISGRLDEEVFRFAFVSDAPFRNRERAPLDAFQASALQQFRRDASLEETVGTERGAGGDFRVRFAIPVRMEAGCVACHNAHPDSPLRNWKVGDVRGIQDIAVTYSLAGQVGTSTALGIFLLFFVGSGLFALREYRLGNVTLLRLNADLGRSRGELEQRGEALRASVSELRTLTTVIDNAPFGISLADPTQPDMPLVYVNQAFCDLTGYSREQALGRNCRFLQGPGTDPTKVATIRHAVQSCSKVEVEILNYRQDGTPFWNRFLMFPSYDSQGNLLHYVGCQADVSAEHEASEKLRRGQQLAEEGARIKSDFLANMSHEIRTPMNAIIGMAHLALGSELTPRQRDYLRKIRSSGEHLLGILNDVLDLSKIEAGKLEVESTPFELGRVLDTVTTLVAQAASDKGLELVVDVPPDVPQTLVGDPLRIGQVLLNFANNAVKFTERGEVAIRVRVERQGNTEADLRFSVVDTGIGLTKEEAARLFRSFEQADTSVSRRYGGTGLGLAIAARLATLMGGEVGVDSNPGAGSTFWCRVRVGLGSMPPRPGASPSLAGRRALVVDDNASAREVLGTLLRDRGVAVTLAASGERALELLQESLAGGTGYDLLFIDARMPDMDGLVLAGRVQSLGLDPAPRVVLVTEFGRDNLGEAAPGAGIGEVLAKPVNASSLLETLTRLLAVAQAAVELPRSRRGAADTGVRGVRVLVAEDNALNREVATELLTDAGVDVWVAENGVEALSCLERERFDVVLMDMQMPKMDGLAATRKIRARPEWALMPVVAMTANALDADRDRCLAAGMSDHLAKPIEPDALRVMVGRWSALAFGVSAADGDAAPLPRRVRGLDVEAGLRQAGSAARLVAMLRRLASWHRHAAENVSRAAQAQDAFAAARAMRIVREVAAIAGAAHIARLAAAVETALAQGATGEALVEPLAAFDGAYAEFIEDLDRELPRAG